MVTKNPLSIKPRNNFRVGYIWGRDYESEVRFENHTSFGGKGVKRWRVGAKVLARSCILAFFALKHVLKTAARKKKLNNDREARS